MENSERFWLNQARSLRTTVNGVLWIEHWALPAIITHILCAVMVLWLRQSPEFSWGPLGWGYGCLWLGLCVWGFRGLRGRVYGVASALSRLEVQHGLYGQLSAAYAGKAEWPEPPIKPERSLAFRSIPLHGWLVLSMVVLVVAAVIPVSRDTGSPLAPNIETPPDMTTVETWLEVLAEDPALDPMALEKFEEQLESLQEEDPASWYDQASLEAASALRQDLEHSLSELADKLDQAHMAISDAADSQQAEEMLSELTLGPEALSALSALPQGVMPWRDSILDQLTEGAADGPMQLNADAMEALQQSMSRTQNTAQTLSDIGTLRRLTEEELQQLLAQGQNSGMGQQPGSGDGDADGNGPGSGGLARGPGTAPLLFRPDDLPFLPENFQAVSNSDLSRASIGETINTRIVSLDEGAQEDVETGILQGARQIDRGLGGTATWQQTLTPAEAARLKKFFQREESP